MAKWEFPPLEDEPDYYAVIRELEADSERPVKEQHVVSKVILKGFAARLDPNKGWNLARFDMRAGRELDPKGLDACGKIKNFITYASRSAEELWQSVENNLGDAIIDANDGGLRRGSKSARVIKDAIALHLVRSPRFRSLHERAAMAIMEEMRTHVLEERGALDEVAYRERHGKDPLSLSTFQRVVDESIERWKQHMKSGALLRVSVERMFRRVRMVLEGLDVQVIHAPPGEEFIISDSPAFTFRYGLGGEMTLQIAIGDSHGIALPLTRSCVVVIAPEHKDEVADSGMVDHLNRIQLQLAERQVYFRPTSSLGSWVGRNRRYLLSPQVIS